MQNFVQRMQQRACFPGQAPAQAFIGITLGKYITRSQTNSPFCL